MKLLLNVRHDYNWAEPVSYLPNALLLGEFSSIPAGEMPKLTPEENDAKTRQFSFGLVHVKNFRGGGGGEGGIFFEN